MSRLVQRELVPYTIPGDCQCGGSPHPDGDVVFFHARLTLDGGAVTTMAISGAADLVTKAAKLDLNREISTLFVIHGIASWNFLDDKGKPIPVTEEVIRNGLDWNTTGIHLVRKADELYSEEAFAPFQKPQPSSSARSQTDGSTSASRPSKSPTKPSRPSSPATSAVLQQ